MLQTVDVGERALETYRGVAPDPILDRLRELADELRGLRVLHLNATPYGGGVSELLRSVIPVLNDLGLVAEWKVISGDESFFSVTKTIHNGLQGAERGLTEAERATFAATSERNAALLEEAYDVIVVHDPQPAAILPLHGKGVNQPLPVEREGREQQECSSGGHENLGVGGLLVQRVECGDRELRRRRQMVAERAHRRVRDRRGLRVDVHPEDEPVLRQQQQRVGLLRLEGLPPDGRRGDHAQPDVRVVERLRRAFERGPKTGRRRRHHCDVVGRLLRERALEPRRPADNHEHDQRRDQEDLAAQALGISRRATSEIARRPLTASPARGRVRRVTGARR
jgi:hypothetical protein